MAKYQIYQDKAETHNIWIKSIPREWKVVPLKYMCRGFVKDGPHETPKFIDDGIPFLSVDGIQKNKLVFEGCRYISIEDDARFSLKCKPRKGNILLGKAASVGKVAFVENDNDFNVWSPLAVINPKDIKLGRFIFYCLQSYELQLQCDVFSNSNTQKNLGMTTIDNLTFPYPSINEAEKISDFLDHETAKIDSLIAKQEKLIELLKEKRQAVISHAVTKGLNPNVVMKDSGVEWLGLVPEHWKCVKIKHITTLFEQGWSPQCDSRPAELNEYGVLKVGCVNNSIFRASENKALPPELEPRLQYLIKKNDLLISRANTKELVGSATVVDDEYPNLILCDKLYRLRLAKNVIPEMVSLYLSISVVREQIELSATGASHSMQNIGQDTINELWYLLPSFEEAECILKKININNQIFNSLIEKAELAIQLMQERRTALISAAVTGKIDVRNWHSQNKNNNQDNKELSA